MFNPVFALVLIYKYLGYRAAGRVLNQMCRQRLKSSTDPVRVNRFSAFRTALGVITGVTILFLMMKMQFGGFALFYLALFPVRYLEWLVTVAWFLRNQMEDYGNPFLYSAYGTAWSFVLDVPAILLTGAWQLIGFC